VKILRNHFARMGIKFVPMKKLVTILLCLAAGASFSQSAEVVKLHKLQELIAANSGNIEVINFWATWCAPCIKELPLFEKITAEKHPDIHVTLVSMDLDLDPNPEKVYKFIARKNIQSRVLLLEEKNPNAWISQIDKEWSGALPATIVINQKTGKRKFVEKELHDGDLEKLIAEVR
jgi:thiol-disulfide isomerase/thioredoxin